VAPRWISMPGLRIACIIYAVVVLWNLVVAGALA
jgi:hypothetical protein